MVQLETEHGAFALSAFDTQDAVVSGHDFGGDGKAETGALTQVMTGDGGPQPRVVLEVGPGRVLTNLARRAYPEVKFLPVGTSGDLDQVLGFLAENNPVGDREQD